MEVTSKFTKLTKVKKSLEIPKYPLESKWSLWYFKMERGIDWKDCQHFVASVGSVEEFWSLYMHTELPSKLNNGCDYSFFKYGVEPAWEDSENRNGGRWIINLDKRMKPSDLDRCWTETLMALVGCQFDDAFDDVCGVVLNIRPRGNKISIWTKNKNDYSTNEDIGVVFKRALNLQNVAMTYQSHADAYNKWIDARKMSFSFVGELCII